MDTVYYADPVNHLDRISLPFLFCPPSSLKFLRIKFQTQLQSNSWKKGEHTWLVQGLLLLWHVISAKTRDNRDGHLLFKLKCTNDRALFARFGRSNINLQEPGNGDTKLSGKGRGEDTCYMSHVILARLETWVIASLCLEVHNNCSCVVVSIFQSFIHLNSTAFVWFLLFMM